MNGGGTSEDNVLVHVRRHTLYSMNDEPSDVLELSPTRKNIGIGILFLFFPPTC